MNKCVLCAIGTALASVTVFSSTVCNAMNQEYTFCLQKKIHEGEPKCAKGLQYIKSLGYVISPSMVGHGHSGGVYLATAPNGKRYALKFTKKNASSFALPNSVNLVGGVPIVNWDCVTWCGDVLLYNTLREKMGGTVDFGAGACKIYGYYEIPNCSGNEYDVCIVLEYIDGQNAYLYIDTHTYCTTDVATWFKDIFASLKIMYENNFWHGSIGKGNIKITKENHAILLDYERAYFLDKYKKALSIGRDFVAPTGDYYDPVWFGRSVIDSFLCGKGYTCNNSELEKRLYDLKNINSADELVRAVECL